MKFVNQECSHHALVEQFTSLSTKHHVSGIKDVTTMCTEYASRLLQHQVEVAQKVDYEFSDGDGSIVTVTYKDHTHNVNSESSTCTCSFWNTMLLRCVLFVTYIEMCKILYTITKEMWLFDSMANTYPNCASLFQDWLTVKTGVTWKDVYASSESEYNIKNSM